MTPAIVQAFAKEQHAANASLYLLLDPLADCAEDDPLHIDTLCQSLGSDAVTRLRRPDLAHTPQACPVLVTLATAGAEPSDYLLSLSVLRAKEDERRSRRYVCGWLSSTATAATVSNHLIELGHLPTSAGKQFFPVYEPLRLELLVATFKHGETGGWWPIHQWLFPTSSGASSCLIGQADTSVVFSPFTSAVQQDAALVSSLLGAWRRAVSLPLTYAPARWQGHTLLPPQAAARAYKQINDARQLGLKNQHDIVTLALHRLILHSSLHTHAYIGTSIKLAIENGTSLGKLFSELNDQSWQRIVSDLTFAGAHQ
ncbi:MULTISPECIES: hypothetical protein [Pseudomonas]|uniref:hypothetical protein n=1 Tax=Pseudomonas TaxID=286 RepID=UPI0008769D08|nr:MULTISPECIES: hypothetical protein [Pseudomonas]TFA85317.1 hypothetical protein F638_1583 [Pseudomonas sp. LAIL14HWK12:I2]SCZ39190.1 hypothetical protein SAMN03159313_5060 [Pseudomonas sp. NFIX46]SDB48959.1 hypothetical protein SAMN03097715_03739 [Pseudomonas putida]SFQ94177.1 hypothetical protein SAMN03159312_0583 [Pseudomonas sp. NFIX49]